MMLGRTVPGEVCDVTGYEGQACVPEEGCDWFG